MRAFGYALCACLLLATTGCMRGIVARAPRVAEGAGYRLELQKIHGRLLPDAPLDTNQIEIEIKALAAGDELVAASIHEPDETPCLAPDPNMIYQVPPFPYQVLSRRTRPKRELLIPFNSWELFRVRGPSRLDLSLRRPDGSFACASFPLFEQGHEHAWRALESWTLGVHVDLALYVFRLDHLSAVTAINLIAGKWLGPIQLYAGGGAGLSTCSEQPCRVSKEDPATNHGYYPLFAGLDALLYRGKRVGAKLAARYKVAWTRTETPGPDPHLFLHGPELSPGIYLAHPGADTPGLPNLPDRLVSFSLDLPVGYVMSNSGARTLSLGLTASMNVFVY